MLHKYLDNPDIDGAIDKIKGELNVVGESIKLDIIKSTAALKEVSTQNSGNEEVIKQLKFEKADMIAEKGMQEIQAALINHIKIKFRQAVLAGLENG